MSYNPSSASRLADFGSGIGTVGATITINTATQSVGIGTTLPTGTLQVGSGITMYGSSGIVSARLFSGPLTGNVTGNVTGNLSGNVTGNINSPGISTFTTLSISGNSVSSLGVGLRTESALIGVGATILDLRGPGVSTVTVSSGIGTIFITGGRGGGSFIMNYILSL